MDLASAFEADRRAQDCRDGIGQRADAKLALEDFEAARVAGLVYAAQDVAWCHFWGLGTPRDPVKSAAILQEEILRFETWIHLRLPLAAQYALGAGVPHDDAACMRLLLEAGSRLHFDSGLRQLWLAAWSGDAPSQYRVAQWDHSDAQAAVWRTRERARWLRLAAEAGLADAQYELARHFETQAGATGDLLYRNVASNWKWKAALQKHERALEELRQAGDGLMGG